MSELDISKDQTFTIPQKALEKLFTYLNSRPYAEVVQLINEVGPQIKPLGETNESKSKET